jgi:hypothetical protein
VIESKPTTETPTSAKKGGRKKAVGNGRKRARSLTLNSGDEEESDETASAEEASGSDKD